MFLLVKCLLFIFALSVRAASCIEGYSESRYVIYKQPETWRPEACIVFVIDRQQRQLHKEARALAESAGELQEELKRVHPCIQLKFGLVTFGGSGGPSAEIYGLSDGSATSLHRAIHRLHFGGPAASPSKGINLALKKTSCGKRAVGGFGNSSLQVSSSSLWFLSFSHWLFVRFPFHGEHTSPMNAYLGFCYHGYRSIVSFLTMVHQCKKSKGEGNGEEH